MIARALSKLDSYIHDEGLRGFDPYDSLASPLFQLPGIRSLRPIRLSAQQILRRLPLNVRPLLGIPKGYNPVTLGLCLQAYSVRAGTPGSAKQLLEERGAHCLSELNRLRSPGYRGASWGYDFDWEGRYASLPAWTPTVVAT